MNKLYPQLEIEFIGSINCDPQVPYGNINDNFAPIKSQVLEAMKNFINNDQYFPSELITKYLSLYLFKEHRLLAIQNIVLNLSNHQNIERFKLLEDRLNNYK